MGRSQRVFFKDQRFDMELVLQTVEREFISFSAKLCKELRELVIRYYNQYINVKTEPRVLVAVVLFYYYDQQKIYVSQKTICQLLEVDLTYVRRKKHSYLERLGIAFPRWTNMLSAPLSGGAL